MRGHGFMNWYVKGVDQGDSVVARICQLGRGKVDFGLFQKFEKFFVLDSPELSLSCYEGR
jgi:hypothetical protein